MEQKGFYITTRGGSLDGEMKLFRLYLKRDKCGIPLTKKQIDLVGLFLSAELMFMNEGRFQRVKRSQVKL